MNKRIITSILALIAAMYIFSGCSEPKQQYATFITDTSYSEEIHTADTTASTGSVTPAETAPTNEENHTEAASTPAATSSAPAETASTPVETSSTPVVTTSAAAATTADPLPVTASKSDSADSTLSAESYVEKPSAPATVSNLNNETFLQYTSIKSSQKPNLGKSVYLYNFNTSLSTGFGEQDIVVPAEALYGLKGQTSNQTVTVTAYDHTGTKSISAVYVESMDACDGTAVQIKTAAQVQFDTSVLSNGLYRVLVTFTNDQTAKLYFYVNGSETLFCQAEVITAKTAESYINRRNDLADVLSAGNVTPQNSLTLDGVCYPFKEFDETWRCDTQRWIELSNTIVDDSQSDEYKLFQITTWIRDNIAYDTFERTVDMSRAQYYMDFTGKYSTYNNMSGTCFDYANIITIMCRAHNIPAVTIGAASKDHVWNIVYVNNRWMEVDATGFGQYYVKDDVTIRFNTKFPIYDGIYTIIPRSDISTMPSDATANQYFQQNTNDVY